MRLVSGVKHADLQTRYQRMVESRDHFEALATERLKTITRLAEEITRLRDEQPVTPVREPQPIVGDVELRRQLGLARRALREQAEQLDVLQAAHVADTRELHDLRQGVAS